MLKKTIKLLITFHTTTDAMAMESACREAQAPGRLIPVPRSITADCGLAWCAPEESEAALTALLRERHIAWQAICHCPV